MFPGCGESDGLFESRAGLSRLLDFPPLIATPGGDADDDEDASSDEIVAVLIPQLFEPFAADFLLDTTRAAYLLVCNGIRSNYPNIRFILSHAGGFVPYASHRMAVAITADTGRSPTDVLDDFASFYFDTALSSSAAALPTLLAFAKPGHITFGSDFPFAPTVAGKMFAAGLEIYPHIDKAAREAIERTNALALFPRLGAAPQPISQSPSQRVRHIVSRSVMRGVARITNST